GIAQGESGHGGRLIALVLAGPASRLASLGGRFRCIMAAVLSTASKPLSGAFMSYPSEYGYGPGGRPVNLRWVIAVVIAVVGIASYYFETSVNPVTGKKQHVAMDVDQEVQLGLQSVPQMAAQMGGAADPREDARARFVAQVGRRLVAESDAERSP